MGVIVPDAQAYARVMFALLPQGTVWEVADLAIVDDDIGIDQGVVTAGLLSLLADARAQPEDDPPNEDDKRGYWADEFAAIPGDRTGSKLWLLAQRTPSGGAVPVAKQYAREALQWFLDDSIASSVDISASSAASRLTLLVEIRSPTGDAISFRLIDLWSNTQVDVTSANAAEQIGSADLGLVLDDDTPLTDRVVYKLLLAISDELARISGRAAQLVEESDPRTTLEMLPEWEYDYGLSSDGTTADRRQRLLTAVLAIDGVRPVDFQEALAPILGFTDPADVQVIETSRATAIAVGNDRIIYQFYIYRNPALPGSYNISDAQRVIDEMAHSHTRGVAIESVSFLFDDPYSLFDRDILGV